MLYSIWTVGLHAEQRFDILQKVKSISETEAMVCECGHVPACPCMCMSLCVHLCACMYVCAYSPIYQELFIMPWEFVSCESVCL